MKKNELKPCKHGQKIFKGFDKNKMVVEITDGMLYIKGDTMYRVYLEPIAKMEIHGLVDKEDEK